MKINFFQKPKKSLGQNFLIDNNIIKKIVEIGEINNNSFVMEIGAGRGSLTNLIIDKKPKNIIAIEKDVKLAELLKKKFGTLNNIKILNKNVLDLLKNKILDKNIIVYGNLPYNISTKILSTLILLEKWPPWYSTLIFMFQKEVADRIIAKTNTKEYGRLAVLSNWRLEVKKHFDVSSNCFFPKPKVVSTVLSFRPIKNSKYILKNPKNLEKITQLFFSNRRKMINKVVKKIFKKDELIVDNLNINLNKRPGELESEIFYQIAYQYENLLS
jgi:16S rRNA (adenine1518-N6/adenine1519-N6)-dimethyltransferase